MDTPADSITPWLNVGAASACIGLVVYMMTRGLPLIVDKIQDILSASQKHADDQRKDFREESQHQRADFREESAQQRDVFRVEIQAQRQVTEKLITEGHEALRGVTRSVEGLREEIHDQFKALKG